MAAFLFPPGPIETFARFRDNSVAYVGTCEEAPDVQVQQFNIKIMNDLGGISCPTNRVYDGETHTLTLTLNRFDWATYQTIKGATVPGGAGPGVFTDGALNRGSLVIGSSDFEFILRYTFGGTAVAPASMPVGRRYYSCVYAGGFETKKGSRITSATIVLEANGIFNPTTRAFSLYSEQSADVLSGLPTVN